MLSNLICLSLSFVSSHLNVYVSLCLSVCLSVCLSLSLLYVCGKGGGIYVYVCVCSRRLEGQLGYFLNFMIQGLSLAWNSPVSLFSSVGITIVYYSALL